MNNITNHLLSELDLHPVLIDIGASCAPPKIWEEIAQHSIYVGFDPDLRDLHEVPDSHFYKATIVNKAITSDKESDEVLFYFTKSPYCSSTLKPDSKSLSNFLFSDLFIVEREAKVQAATLDSVMERLSLSRIDWFKTDSQGTDLRIFNSLKPKVRSRVLAVDIEPGLIDAYVGEDLFVDAHRDLTQNGFWLSNLNVCGAIRMRRSNLEKMAKLNEKSVASTVRKSPGWCEARYLRTIEWMDQRDFTNRDYVLLWSFALLDGQYGFAMDLGIGYEQRFGIDKVSQIMQNEPSILMKRSIVKAFPFRVVRRIMQLFD